MNSVTGQISSSDEQDADTAARAQGEERIRRLRRTSLALSGVPALVCAALTFRYAYDAPYWDAWAYVEPVSRAFEGTLTPADFWMRNNEHILFMSNLIVIPLARLTHWDMRFEVASTLLAFVGAFGLLARTALRAEGDGAVRGSLWALPIVALFMFSPSQHAIWSWGLHLCIGLGVLFIVASLIVLTRPRLRVTSFGSAVMAALAATFSVGAGVAVWPAGALAMVLRRDIGWRQRRGYLAAWLVTGACACVIYLVSRGNVPEYAPHASPEFVDYVVYVLAYLGGPIVPYSGALAFVAGLALVVLAGMVAAASARPTADHLSVLLIALTSIGITVGVLTSLKHAHEGVANAVSSRFLPWPTLSWCALVIAWYRVHPRSTAGTSRGAFAAALLVAVAALGWIFGAYKMDEHYDAFSMGRRALVEEPESPNLIYLHPRPDTIVHLRDKLVEHKLTVFRD